jgi:sulfonate transport system substrate-binding protein
MSMTTQRRHSSRPFGTVVGLVSAIGLMACGSAGTPVGTASASPAEDLSTVTLRLGDQQRRLETMMQAAGQLKGLEYQVQWAEFPSGPPMLQAEAAGALDLGSVGDTPPIFSAAAGGTGAQVRIVAASSAGGDRDQILVPSGSSIATVAQLRGKRVAVARGSSAHLTLLLALQKAGLTWGDIDPVYLQPPLAQSAFTTHQIDAWAVWYPFIAVALSDGGRVLLNGLKLDPGYSFLVSDVTSLQDAGRSAALADFLHHVTLAQVWANAHLTKWSALYAQITGLSLAQATETERNEERTYVPVNGAVQRAEQAAADSFTTGGLISKVDISKILDSRFNKNTTLG